MEPDKILSGKKVVHSKLGQGVIEEIRDNYLIVRFGEDGRVSRFAFPDAFENFLTIEDDEAREVVDRHLRIRHLLNAEQERRRRAKLQQLNDELELKHREEMLRKQKNAMTRIAREKRLKNKGKVIA